MGYAEETLGLCSRSENFSPERLESIICYISSLELREVRSGMRMAS